MTRAPESYDRYRADFRAFEEGLPAKGPAWLRDMRKQALSSFDSGGFPTARRGNERWKYTNVAPIAKGEFEYPFDIGTNGVGPSQIQDIAPWDEGWARLVFLDGQYTGALSTDQSMAKGLRISNLPDAIAEDGDLVREHLSRYAVAEEDGFTAVNTAFIRDGAFVHVPEGVSDGPPLHLVFVTTERPQPIVSYPRILIVAGRHSKLTLVESYVSLSQESYFTDAVAEMVVEEEAQIEHYRYLSESPNAFHVGTTRVHQERDSTFSSTSFATGARIARNDLQVLLDGSGSSCFLNGLYFTSGKQHLDNHINIDHARPHSASDQYFKGILADTSRAVFSGRVLVRPDAQKSYARQSDKNLILSDGARLNTKPSLEIFADDVQCFHGATAGAVAQDALFYMRTRGLDEETARALLIYGFAREIIERVQLAPLRDCLDRMLSGALPGVQVAAA